MSDSPNDNDSLGSSFVSSFSLPPPSPAQEPKPSATGQTDATDVDQLIISQDENTNAEAPDPVVAAHSESTSKGISDDPSAVTNPAATQSLQAEEDWKSTLDKNLEGWRAESAEARAKSESTRLRLEEEAARERKRVEDEQKAERERLKREAEDAEVERKVKELLEGKKGKGHAAAPHHHHHEGMDERRWNAVRNAWEVAQSGSRVAPVAPQRSEFEEEEPVEVDGRDMVAGDHGGRDGNKAAEVLQKLSQATEAVTHSDGNLNPTPASATRRADLLSASAEAKPSNEREAVADAWRANAQKSAEEKGAGEASGQKHPVAAAGEKKAQQPAEVSRPSDANEDSSSRATPSHPEQPPSLTLSLFTSRLTPARIAAVVGINVVLPFINGVMLGFGEIFARECIRVVRGVWRGERGWRIGGWGGVAGVGLREGARAVDMSGSGSFP